jgi:hypothetical protein
MDGFEKFTQAGASFSPKMTIRKGGHLGISQGAANRYGIDGDGYYAIFYYNREKAIIGLELTKEAEADGAIKVQWRKHAGGFVIQCSIRSFLDYYNIDYSQTTSYTPRWDDKSRLILIDLVVPKAANPDLSDSVQKPIEKTPINEGKRVDDIQF